MDRDRLKEIQTADLSQSNVNEDFVLWLKTKGPSYLIIIMIIIVAYLFVVQYKRGKANYRAEAWIAYLEANASGLPASHEDVALTYADVDSIGVLGLLNAADLYLRSVILNRTIGISTNTAATLTTDDRTFYLEKADDLYRRVVALEIDNDISILFVVSGLNGRAAVSEATGDIDAARGFYETVIARVETEYPSLANQAKKRIETLAPLAIAMQLPTDAEVTARNNQVMQRYPIYPNAAIAELIDLTDSGSN